MVLDTKTKQNTKRDRLVQDVVIHQLDKQEWMRTSCVKMRISRQQVHQHPDHTQVPLIRINSLLGIAQAVQ